MARARSRWVRASSSRFAPRRLPSLGLRLRGPPDGEQARGESQPRRRVLGGTPEDLAPGLGRERGLLQLGQGGRGEPHEGRVEGRKAPPVGLSQETQGLVPLPGLGQDQALDEQGFRGTGLPRLLVGRRRRGSLPEALLQPRREAVPFRLRLLEPPVGEQAVDPVEGLPLVRRACRRREPQEGQDQGRGRASGGAHGSGSTMRRTRLIAGRSSRCTPPLGQRTSIEAIAVSAPNPKCTRRSLAE